MDNLRTPLQGTLNIVRFNWHFYGLAVCAILVIIMGSHFINNRYVFYSNALCIIIVATTFISLAVSLFIYDLSGFYSLQWLDSMRLNSSGNLINIHAGFDETSVLLKAKYPAAALTVFDFYDPKKHTEISIRRARKTYPPYPNTIRVSTVSLPSENYSADDIVVIFSAHEIRNNEERIVFFKELKRTLVVSGKIIVTEHLRDLPNFLAYNIGAFHFLSHTCWRNTFSEAGLIIKEEIKINPFITTFILTANGNTSESNRS